LVIDDGLCRGDAEGRVVIERVVFMSAVVDDVVPCLLQVSFEDLFEFESGVVGAEVNLHVSAFRWNLQRLSPLRERTVQSRPLVRREQLSRRSGPGRGCA
jgi:hypothetical protein